MRGVVDRWGRPDFYRKQPAPPKPTPEDPFIGLPFWTALGLSGSKAGLRYKAPPY